MAANHYDFIIIGTGAGGGTLAYKLAPTGKSILILERGDYIPREKENWDSDAVFNKGIYTANESWLDSKGNRFQPGAHYCVGGNTKLYGAALFRMRKEDFGELQHVDGISPAWPIQYEDLQPFYNEAERLYHVHGKRGVDETEPPETEPFPYPPVPHEPRIQELHDDLVKIGLNPFPIPLGVRFGEGDPAVAPATLDRFDGYPDPSETKADAHVVAVREAVRHPNVTLKTNSLVHRLITDESGRKVTGVVVEHQGETTTYSADTVVVSCGAINSAILLLKSKNEKHPNGLANSSDAVGRHYMCHNNSAVVALSKRVNPTKFGKTLACNDYYFGDETFPYPIGHIQMLGKSDADQFKGDAPAITPHLTLEVMAQHALDFWLTTEDLPDPENRVTIDEEGQVTLHYKENNLEAHKLLVQKLKDILEHIGCQPHLLPNNVYLGKKIPIAGVAHQCGTTRFGTDPATSVLDVNCKAHDLDNLYVVDGGFMPSSSSVNPGLTIIANALRVGAHLIEKMKSA